MAGPRKPIDLLVRTGRKHFTKQEIKQRTEQERRMLGPTENIKPPSYLTAVQKRDFNEISVQLVELNMFSELDVDSLARYLDSKYQYFEVLKGLKKIKPTTVIETDKGNQVVPNESHASLIRTRNMIFKECRAAARDLGLDISSQLNLSIPKEGKRELSEFEKRFGDRI
ncbi:P27 family phage terminase small subunit [Lysinibacillus fusiformis]|uniref:P27 family phage terminase small subunit n=1 Tax=Lysinibacillus fusiformis TaxID=28031 RepID=UPI00215A675B|nr:P27 family phage terminase small subunit [Lysinibacillus fusiformis]MCR8853498.1 P27 family phage terminase small subunit [Lysinibacillus fusiformis]